MAIATPEQKEYYGRIERERTYLEHPSKMQSILKYSAPTNRIMEYGRLPDIERNVYEYFHRHELYNELLTMGVFTRILKHYDSAMMSEVYQLQAYFNPTQLDQWEKNRMMDKLAGKQ